MNRDDLSAIEAVINEKWRQRFSAGAMTTETANFVNGLKEDLLKDIRGLVPGDHEAEDGEAEGK